MIVGVLNDTRVTDDAKVRCPVYDVTVEHNVPATMRDGTVLKADVYRPTASGPWPVLLTRLPYGKHLPGMIRLLVDPLGLARGGYIVVVQDTRGRVRV